MFYFHINYRYIIDDQRMMSFGFSGSPPLFWKMKYADDDDDDDDDVTPRHNSAHFWAGLKYRLSVGLCVRVCVCLISGQYNS